MQNLEQFLIWINVMEYILNESSIPNQYTKDISTINLNDFEFRLYSKAKPNEKDIVRIYPSKDYFRYDKISGWLVPVISLLSDQHDHAKDKFFIDCARIIYKKYKDSTINENIYILALNKKCFSKSPSDFDYGCLSLSFSSYGVFPYYETITTYNSNNLTRMDNIKNITIFPSVNIDNSINFIADIFKNKIQDENNLMCRFILFYQMVELCMEISFHCEIEKMKDTRKSLYEVREKIKELSKENSIIKCFYDSCGIDKKDLKFNKKLKEDFNISFDQNKFYISQGIYKIRNIIFHSFYKLENKIDMDYYASYMQNQASSILEGIFLNKSMHSFFSKNYISQTLDSNTHIVPVNPYKEGYDRIFLRHVD